MNNSNVNFEKLQTVGKNLNEFFAEIAENQNSKERVQTFMLPHSIWGFLEKDQCN